MEASRLALLESDGNLVFSPGFTYLEQLEESGGLIEGKALGTAREMDLTLTKDFTHIKDADPARFQKDRKTGQTVGRRKLIKTQNETRTRLLDLVQEWQLENISARRFRSEAVKAMKMGWKAVFQAGVRAGGTRGLGAGPGKAGLVDLDPVHDAKWLRSAMQHEMRFLNKFVEAVIDDTWKMPLPRRVEMYVNALTSFYESARVISLPPASVIHWVGPNDKVTCPSCAYLFEHSPYTKKNLATVPRSGLTLCLCLLNYGVDVLTERGMLSLKDVRAGDRVWTHKSRWRRVLGKPVNRVCSEHRFAVLVGEGGRLFGVTDDHPVFTAEGWVSANEAKQRELQAVRCGNPWIKERTLSILRNEAPVAVLGDRQKNSLWHTPKWAATTATLRGFVHRTLHMEKAEGWAAVCACVGRGFGRMVLHLPLPVGVGASAWGDSCRLRDTPRERRLHRRPAGELGIDAADTALQTTRQGTNRVGELELERGKDTPDGVPTLWRDFLCGKLQNQNGANEVLFCDLSRQSTRESCRVGLRALWKRVQGAYKRGGEGGTSGIHGSFLLPPVLRGTTDGGQCASAMCAVRDGISAATFRDTEVGGCQLQGKFLLSELLARTPERDFMADPCLRLLREEFHSAEMQCRQVEVGQILLLKGVLEPGTPLYDLTTEEDHSFVVNGLILHNSNCRDKLFVRRESADVAEAVTKKSRYTRSGHIRNLRRIKRLGHL